MIVWLRDVVERRRERRARDFLQGYRCGYKAGVADRWLENGPPS